MVRAGRSGFRILQGQEIFFLFFKKSKPTLGPIQPSFQWAPGFFFDDERPEREVDYSLPLALTLRTHGAISVFPLYTCVVLSGRILFYVFNTTVILLLGVLWPEIYALCTLRFTQDPQFALNVLPRHFFSCLRLILSFPASKRMARSIDWAWRYPSWFPPGCGTFSWWFRMGLDDTLREV